MMLLRDYQEAAVDACWWHLCNRSGNPIIVIPTGGGKTAIECTLARRAVEEAGAAGVMLVSHVSELVAQVAGCLDRMGVDHGVYAAGLSRRETGRRITSAMLNSVYNRASEFGKINLLLIDECHRVGGLGGLMYGRLIDGLRQANPRMKVVGLSATPFRLDSGPLVQPGSMWERICYEARVKTLVDAGWLSPMTNEPTKAQFDLAQLQVVGKDYSEASQQSIYHGTDLERAVIEMVDICNATGRRSVIVFCPSVQVVEEVTNLIGVDAAMVHGGISDLERAAAIDGHKSGAVRFLVNCEVLTTGYDAPGIDAVVLFRATQSAGLFAQMAGRGFRVAEGKKDCLLLDYGGNLMRHGPLDALDYGYPRKPGEGKPPLKKCPACEEQVPASWQICQHCGFEFPVEPKEIDLQRDEQSKVYAEPEEFEVIGWSCRRWENRTNPEKPNTLRVDYEIRADYGPMLSEWICLLHEGFAGEKAEAWWQEHRGPEIEGDELNDRIDVAIGRFDELRMPSKIWAIQDGKFWRITKREFSAVVADDFEDVPF